MPDAVPAPGCDPARVATALYNACKGFGTNEAAVWAAVGSVRTQYDWDTVCEAFRAMHADMSGGDLRAALEADLAAGELVKAKSILAGNGVQWHSAAAAARGPSSAGSPPEGSPLRTTYCDGPCVIDDALPAREVTFKIPRLVQRTVVEPKVVHKTVMEKRAVPCMYTEQEQYETEVMIPEPVRRTEIREVVVREIEVKPKTLRRVVMTPQQVTKTVKVQRPVTRTVEDVEVVAEEVQVDKEIRTTEMVPQTQMETIFDREVQMQTRLVESIKPVQVVKIHSKNCESDDHTVRRLVEFIRAGFGDIDALDISIEFEPRKCMIQEEFPVETAAPRSVERVVMVPREKVETVQVTEYQPKEVRVSREVTEIVEEEKEITVTEMVETIEETVVEEEEIVERVEQVPEERVDIVMVPKKVTSSRTVEKTRMSEVEEPRTVAETEMVTRCCVDHFEETRTLRFNPITGEQVGGEAASPVRSVPAAPLYQAPPYPQYAAAPYQPAQQWVVSGTAVSSAADAAPADAAPPTQQGIQDMSPRSANTAMAAEIRRAQSQISGGAGQYSATTTA